MSKAIKWQDAEVFQPNKEKLLQNILGEIIHLNKYLTEAISNIDKDSLKNTIDILYYIFQIIEERDYDLSDNDSIHVMNYIYQIIENVLLNQT